MTPKQLLYLLMIVVIAFPLMIGGGGYLLYIERPEMLPERWRPPVDTTTIIEIDSVALVRGEMAAQVLSSDSVKNSLNRELQKLQDSISGIQVSLDSTINESKGLQVKLENEQDENARKRDSLVLVNYDTFAKIYNSANPADVAAILQNLDDRDASVILKLMKREIAAKVLESMEPQRAASILTLSAIEF